VTGSRRHPRRAAARALVAALVAVLALAWPAASFVPTAERTIEAIAEVNRSSGRGSSIQLDLVMRIGDRGPLAEGELISHPTGLARLELRGYSGRVDRYLLSGNELLAAKDGVPLDRPQPMLQPIFLLQPATETTLRAALATFGVQSEWIGLAPCGDEDCFVIGDPRLDARPPSPPEGPSDGEAGGGAVVEDPLAGIDDGGSAAGRAVRPLSGPTLDLPGEGLIPRLWVSTGDLQVRRIDRRSGVFVIFGPTKHFEKLVVPAWFEIHEPGAQPIRFEVERALSVNAAPKAFSRKWVFAPVETDAAEAADPSPDAPAPAAGAATSAR
jgi:hypothetical protein